MKQTNENESLVPNNKIKQGMELAKKKVEYFLKMLKDLHDMGDYELALPLAVLVFEESSKISDFYHIRKDKRDITIGELKNLHKHNFKLTGREKREKERITNESDLDLYVQGSILESLGLKSVTNNKDEAITVKEKSIEIQARLSKIKEICFYTNWNHRKKDWDDFDKIPISDKKSLSLFITYLAEQNYLIANLCVDTMNNPFRDISNEELWDEKKTNEFLISKITHGKNMDSIKKMKEFEQNIDSMSTEIQKGLKLFNKYFSN